MPGSPQAPPTKVGRKVVFVLAANVAGAVMGYGALLVIGRAFDPAAYGAFVFASSLGGFYALATTLGLGTAHQRLVARGEPEAAVLGTAAGIRLLLMAGIALVVAAVLAGAAALGHPLLTDATTPTVLGGALAIQVVAMGRQLFAETWGGRQAVARIEMVRLVDAGLMLALLANAGLLLRHLAGAWAPVPKVGAWWAHLLGWSGPPTPEAAALLLVACTLIAKVASTLLAVVWAVRDGVRLGRYDTRIARELWAFGLPLAMAGAIGLVVQYTDVVLLGYFWADRDVGLYGTAQKLSIAAMLAATAASGVLLSRFAQTAASGDRAEEERTFERAEHWILLLVVPVVAALVGLAPQGLHIAVGDRYLGAAGAVRFLGLAALAYAVQVPLSARFMGHGRARVLVVSGAVNAIANAALNLLFIPKALLGWGVAGAGAATFASNLLAYAYLRAQAHRAFGVPWVTASQVRIAVAGTLLGLAWWQAAVHWPATMVRVWGLAAWGAVGVVAYLVLLWALRAFTRDDLRLIHAAAHPAALLRELRGKHD